MWLRAMKFIEGLFLTLQLAGTVLYLADTCNAVRRSQHNVETDMRNGHAGCRVIRQT